MSPKECVFCTQQIVVVMIVLTTNVLFQINLLQHAVRQRTNMIAHIYLMLLATLSNPPTHVWVLQRKALEHILAHKSNTPQLVKIETSAFRYMGPANIANWTQQQILVNMSAYYRVCVRHLSVNLPAWWFNRKGNIASGTLPTKNVNMQPISTN
jgi:hypothetical protein